MNLFKKTSKIKIDQTKLLTLKKIEEICISVIREKKRHTTCIY